MCGQIQLVEKKSKEKSIPFGVNLMRSHVLYRADQAIQLVHMHSLQAIMAAAGITGVKVDCQAGVGLIGSAMGGGPALAQQYHLALEDSIKQHFPTNDCINCMCHSTENFYRQAVSCFIETTLLPFACQILAVSQLYKYKQSASTVTCFHQLSVWPACGIFHLQCLTGGSAQQSLAS